MRACKKYIEYLSSFYTRLVECVLPSLSLSLSFSSKGRTGKKKRRERKRKIDMSSEKREQRTEKKIFIRLVNVFERRESSLVELSISSDLN